MGFFSDAWNGISNWWNDNIAEPVSDWWNEKVIHGIGGKVTETMNNLGAQEIANKVSTAMTDSVTNKITPVQDQKNTVGDIILNGDIETKENSHLPNVNGTPFQPMPKTEETESEKAAKESVLDTEETPNASNVDTEKIIASNEEMLKKYWEREDKIREETQKREDTAYQRAVNDMRKAGINPNLVGINPANSGGGITQSSRIEPTASAEINAITSELINAINNEVKIEENKKDRITDIIRTILGISLLK